MNNHETRQCRGCGKRLARLNRGPFCFSCAPDDFTGGASRQRRARLPHEEIVIAYRRSGDVARVARELDLPRSSVWYAVQRARRDGLLGHPE